MILNSIVAMVLLKIPFLVVLATAFIAGLVSFAFAHTVVTEEEIDKFLERRGGE